MNVTEGRLPPVLRKSHASAAGGAIDGSPAKAAAREAQPLHIETRRSARSMTHPWFSSSSPS